MTPSRLIAPTSSLLMIALFFPPAGADLIPLPPLGAEIISCESLDINLDECGKSCPATEDTIGILYANENYGGACLRLTGGSCVGALWYLTSMPDNWYSSTWNDRASSGEIPFTGESLGCGSMTVWQHENFNGRDMTCSVECTDFHDNDLNDMTSSLVICSGTRTCPIPGILI